MVLKQASELRAGDWIQSSNGGRGRIEQISRGNSTSTDHHRYVGKVIVDGSPRTVIVFEGGEPIETWSDNECVQPTP